MRINEILASEISRQAYRPEVFLDMDGVLADFFGELARVARVQSGRYREIPRHQIEPTLDSLKGTDFFGHLPKFPSADRLVQIVSRVFGHYNICSTPLEGDEQNSARWKRVWLQQHLTSLPPKKMMFTSEKQQYATQPDGTPNILIDDRGDNIRKWEAAGGVGIKYQADEDDLAVVTNGLKRAFEIIRHGRRDDEANKDERSV